MKLNIVSNLFYSWTGWPRPGAVPENLPQALLNQLQERWESDGLKLYDCRWTIQQCQLTFQSAPAICPIDITRKGKGRLVHALRELGYSNCFSRKVSLRSVGDNSTKLVTDYVATQLDRSGLADSRYICQLEALKYYNSAIILKQPQMVTHGRYWNNMHIVIVIADRFRISSRDLLERMRKAVIAWGDETLNHSGTTICYPAIHSFSIMPDHMHIIARAPVDRSSEFLLDTLWQRLNAAAGFLLCSDEVYAGTFSEYSIGAIRGKSDWPLLPPGQARWGLWDGSQPVSRP